CVAWRRQAENLANYMKKGSQVGVDGRLQSRSYEDKDGKMVYVTEVVADNIQFLDSRGASQESGQGISGQRQTQQPSEHQSDSSGDVFKNEGEPIDISDDDLPF